MFFKNGLENQLVKDSGHGKQVLNYATVSAKSLLGHYIAWGYSEGTILDGSAKILEKI